MRGHGGGMIGLRAVLLAVGSACVLGLSGCGDSTATQANSDAAQTDANSQAADDAQIAWDDRRGPDWTSFATAFSDGFTEGCSRLFATAPDGSLYDGDTEYSETDCEGYDPGDDPEGTGADVPATPPVDPQVDGEDLGIEQGCNAIFDNEGIDTLYWGRDEFTAQDCIDDALPEPDADAGGGGEPPATTTERQTTTDEKTTTDETQGQSCGSIDFSGVETHIEVLRGTDCAEALDVAKSYETGQPPSPWQCFIGREGDPEKLACGYGGGSGDVQDSPHAFVGR